MFCSNCGKEIAEGSAFCSGCGKSTGNGQPAAAPVQQVVYVNQVQNKGIAGAPGEVKIKTGVFLLYFFGAAMLLAFILIILATKLGIFAELMDISSFSQGTFQEYLEHFYEESLVIILLLSLMLLLPETVKGIVLWKACVNRSFADKQNNVIVNCVLSSIFWIIMLPILSSITSNRLNSDVSFTALTYLLIVCVIAYKIIYAVLYYNAVVCEERYVSMEEKNRRNPKKKFWVCDKCGTENDTKYSVCQKCGDVHGKVSNQNYWICKSCNTENDRKDLYCKFCGKYK